MARVEITSNASGGGSVATGVLQLLGGVPMSSTLVSVTDQNNTTSPLKLSTTLVQVVSTLKITTADNPYIDAEDSSGNNRFTIGRDPSSQQVNVDFASNPTGSTTTVGAIRTYKDGTNLSEAMNFREDGNVGVGDVSTQSPTALLDVIRYTTGSVNNNYQMRILNSADGQYPYSVLLLEHNNRTGVGNQGGCAIVIKDGFANVNRAGIGFDYFNSTSYTNGGGSLRLSNDGQGNVYIATNGTDAIRVFKDQGVQIGGISTSGSTSTARLLIKGSGSTSATTSLLVQNSAGNTSLQVTDDQQVTGYSGTQLKFRLGGNLQPGINTRNGALCVGIIDAGFQSGLQISASSSTGKTFIDGWNDGGSNQYDIVIGNQGSRTQFGTDSSSVSSSQVTINSTTRGFLPPRMTNAQRAAIGTPAIGLMVYCTDAVEGLYVYKSTGWTFVI